MNKISWQTCFYCWLIASFVKVSVCGVFSYDECNAVCFHRNWCSLNSFIEKGLSKYSYNSSRNKGINHINIWLKMPQKDSLRVPAQHKIDKKCAMRGCMWASLRSTRLHISFYISNTPCVLKHKYNNPYTCLEKCGNGIWTSKFIKVVLITDDFHNEENIWES